ncbi:hypothetical protein H112_04271 [Trichophyton rubrum D6]|uniref:Cysteine-rich secreted protein n=3 Tax=Trichophyton TaxID=5550 RepID=F2SPP9_TRIRC|nr:uncharacterized protein TERG_04047 [Trichophyton rubrum CBS 118892]EZF22759.1 hypothetical protein H100_04278 [Trichophyton rubrum MR850]EZF42011.1 hypothetical protein H102_04263 [Trichophyton rubrum CBS 100081]EZF52716.1 hypothetical protein H103_04271 [Trichophyton rubrum CBS 288.86]EZF63217.1 hypothetical protein H104_04261 [Trichophyton rubrum CBS 289.86]EZF73950.1 hypothetical protein H105_04288 [Trichophyton soudanense CBS 452.61]EZF84552.1 hypothetical protein H110_04266 [Trichophy
MKLIYLGLLSNLLNSPSLTHAANVAVRKIGKDAMIKNNKVTWMGEDGFQDGFSCPDTHVLQPSADQQSASCCLPGLTLKGSSTTSFDCCAEGHDLAGSEAVGYICCPTGQIYDGKVCKNGKPLMEGKCACSEDKNVTSEGCCEPEECSSGLKTGKCYTFKESNGYLLGYLRTGKYYNAAPDSRDRIFGKFQLCRDQMCNPGRPINAGDELYIKDLHGTPMDGADAGQWMNNAADGPHIGKTPNFAMAGRFAITKWPCGKYCITGAELGLGPACPADQPALTFYTRSSEPCVPYELTEVPCSVRSIKNNCIWYNGKDQCCNKIDCSERKCHK